MKIEPDEKINFLRHLYREDSAFSDNVKLAQLREINVETPAEDVILKLIRNSGCVVLTGNAGDGKTHLIRLNKQKFENQQTYIVQDASAIDAETLIGEWSTALAAGNPCCVAINEGPLLDLIKTYKKAHPFLQEIESQMKNLVSYVPIEIEKGDTPKSKKKSKSVETTKHQIHVIDLSKRHYLSKQLLSAILNKLTEEKWYEGCHQCPGVMGCGGAYNRKALRDPVVQTRLALLLEEIAIMDVQPTFREMMAFCSYLIFGNRTCEQLIEAGDSETTRYYNLAFEGGVGTVFEHLAQSADPAYRTHPLIDDKLWQGTFNPEDYKFEPKPIATPLNGEKKPLDIFVYRKRRWYFEHPEGAQLIPKTPSQEFFKKLRDRSLSVQQRVSEIVRRLNKFHFSGARNEPDYLRLWTQLAFSPKNKSRSKVSGKKVPTPLLRLYEPQLAPILEQCFGESPINHLLLGPTNKDQLRYAYLRIDLRLIDLLSGIGGLTVDDAECSRRIERLNTALAQFAEDSATAGECRNIVVVEGRSGKAVEIRVDLQTRSYDDVFSVTSLK